MHVFQTIQLTSVVALSTLSLVDLSILSAINAMLLCATEILVKFGALINLSTILSYACISLYKIIIIVDQLVYSTHLLVCTCTISIGHSPTLFNISIAFAVT